MGIKVDMSDFVKTWDKIEKEQIELNKINTDAGVNVKTFSDIMKISSYVRNKENTKIILEDYNGNRIALSNARLEKNNDGVYLILK